jgi:DnaJ domain
MRAGVAGHHPPDVTQPVPAGTGWSGGASRCLRLPAGYAILSGGSARMDRRGRGKATCPHELKRAYRKLAKQYHPDVNDSSDAVDRFREITEAYDTLTDPDRRRRYDRLHGIHTGTGTWSGFTSSGNGTRAQNGSAHSNGSQAASRILKVLEDTWLEIRRWHPEIPPAVILIIASGTDGKQTRLGTMPPAGGTSQASSAPRS